MEESYENLKNDHAELIKNFHIHPKQTGILIMTDGEIKKKNIINKGLENSRDDVAVKIPQN